MGSQFGLGRYAHNNQPVHHATWLHYGLRGLAERAKDLESLGFRVWDFVFLSFGLTAVGV